MPLRLDHAVHVVQDLDPWPSPFLIQWGLGGDARRADLTARGVIADHPLGAGLQLRRVAWAVTDLSAGAAWLERVYGLKAGAPVADDQLGALCADTGAGLLLCAPAGPGLVRERLAVVGQGPFLYDLAGPGLLSRLLKVHGAWLRMVSA